VSRGIGLDRWKIVLRVSRQDNRAVIQAYVCTVCLKLWDKGEGKNVRLLSFSVCLKRGVTNSNANIEGEGG